MQHKETLINEDIALKQMLAWKTFGMYGLWLVLATYVGTNVWFAYSTQIWLDEPTVWAVWGIERLAIIFSLFVLLGLMQTATKMLTRFRLEQNLRFDVFAAVTEVTSQALARHLPDYQKLTTVVAIGEELLKPAEQMSRRSARIQLALQQQLPGLGLADAINQIVRDALRSEDIAGTVGNVETILTKIENGGTGDNVVQLEQRPSA
ncbi:hypothetical protein K2P47_03735 [Patescibacteria group bacterium]|nr:hypothetical protein [Patescibacteria group bacterium]